MYFLLFFTQQLVLTMWVFDVAFEKKSGLPRRPYTEDEETTTGFLQAWHTDNQEDKL